MVLVPINSTAQNDKRTPFMFKDIIWSDQNRIKKTFWNMPHI